MSKGQRFLEEGVTMLNGYEVTIVRIIKACPQCRHAMYFGSIKTPDGEVISLGENGKNSQWIKQKCGNIPTKQYNRSGSSGESQQLRELRKARETMIENGLSTTDVDNKITELVELDAQMKAEKEAERKAKSTVDKAIRKQIKKLETTKATMLSVGLDVTELNNKIAELQSQLS